MKRVLLSLVQISFVFFCCTTLYYNGRYVILMDEIKGANKSISFIAFQIFVGYFSTKCIPFVHLLQMIGINIFNGEIIHEYVFLYEPIGHAFKELSIHTVLWWVSYVFIVSMKLLTRDSVNEKNE